MARTASPVIAACPIPTRRAAIFLAAQRASSPEFVFSRYEILCCAVATMSVADDIRNMKVERTRIPAAPPGPAQLAFCHSPLFRMPVRRSAARDEQTVSSQGFSSGFSLGFMWPAAACRFPSSRVVCAGACVRAEVMSREPRVKP